MLDIIEYKKKQESSIGAVNRRTLREKLTKKIKLNKTYFTTNIFIFHDTLVKDYILRKLKFNKGKRRCFQYELLTKFFKSFNILYCFVFNKCIFVEVYISTDIPCHTRRKCFKKSILS